MTVRTAIITGVLGVFMTAFAHAATSSPAPMSCPNAARYTEAGTKCTQASQGSDLEAQVTSCPLAALEAGQCAAAESGLARLDEIGNEATFAMTSGLAIHAQPNGENADAAIGWLRVAMALFRQLANDPSAPADMRDAASQKMSSIAQTPWYVDGPPPQSPPGAPAAPPMR